MRNYQLYLQPYMKEALSEFKHYQETSDRNEYIEKDHLSDDYLMEDKSEVYKINYYLRDHIQKLFVTDLLKKSAIRESIIEFTGKFLDNHSTQLSTSGPVYMFTFSDKETSFFYDTFKIKSDEIIKIYYEMINETYYGKISKFITGWVENAPHKILITSILIDAIQNNYSDIIECCEYLWAFCEYPLVYREFWQTGVKEDVMNYTVEHLGAKYKVTKVNNLQGLLKYDAHSAVSFFTERLKNGADNVYIDFMQRMRNQIKNTFKNIAKAYYINIETNATQHNNVTQFDDGSLADQEGATTNITQVVDNTVSKFAMKDINTSMVKIVSDRSKVDKNNVTGYIAQIYASKNNRLSKFIENIITAYFEKNPTNTSVGSSEFLNFGISLYRSIATSKNPIYQEIRAILDLWMYDIIDIKSQYNHVPTIINYTRSIFDYMILMINYYN